VAKYRERRAARVAEIKGALTNWLEPRDSEADSVSVLLILWRLEQNRPNPYGVWHDACEPTMQGVLVHAMHNSVGARTPDWVGDCPPREGLNSRRQ
jgi:hypothetical protein